VPNLSVTANAGVGHADASFGGRGWCRQVTVVFLAVAMLVGQAAAEESLDTGAPMPTAKWICC